MPETDDYSRSQKMTLEQLLQVKRLEKPSSEFWLSFELELKEKQLKALVKPGRRQRFRTVLLPRLAVLAPLTAVAGIAALVLSTSWMGIGGNARLPGMEEELASPGATLPVLAAGTDLVEMEKAPTARPRLADPQFVVDALVPERSSQESFRTVSVPQTFLASTDGTAHYVMNVFTAGRRESGGSIKTSGEF